MYSEVKDFHKGYIRHGIGLWVNGKMRTLSFGNLTMFFSYSELIGCLDLRGDKKELVLCNNVWSTTTGNHLIEIEKEFSKREEITVIHLPLVSEVDGVDTFTSYARNIVLKATVDKLMQR